MGSKVEKLVEECAKKTDLHNYWNLVKWSLTNNFKELQDISFDEIDSNCELKQFIKICDNRLDRSKTFLKHIALLLGFDLTALTILATLATKENMPSQNILFFHGYVTFVILFTILILLSVSLTYYRSDIHAWIAFKEKALMKQEI